ncbi:UDP-N-acetylmuramate--L-alanine ligase [Streptomyces sp. BE20]|uniref:UDP-N-acetylmuramate--L-alanine ligase n=1 Tax=Streptomyces sp. BE20 TaxID=3002525 RepID=UPI002E777126|nr:UDP-N-acetylmuramate--L-alanine ligase [Streptomyces sp. BE20]MEE1829269.1 UDP-N-acetylmuramate--L-alanine ligase [Streptomyces sp. BE20]
METRNVIVPVHDGPLDLSRPHFVGIGGAGMSAVARLLLESGSRVSGSDTSDTAALRALEDTGARVFVGHTAANLPADATILVWSSAVTPSNPEVAAARRSGIPVVHRSDVLAHLIASAEQSVAVAGTHGKTMTTGILSAALGHLDPSYAIGGTPVGRPNAHHGTGGLLIAEADESDRTAGRYHPRVAIVLNVDDDHPEQYVDLNDVLDTIERLARNSSILVVSADDHGARLLAERLQLAPGPRVVTVGESRDADVRVMRVLWDGEASHVTVQDTDGAWYQFILAVPGRHNAMNAAAAFAAGRTLGAEPADLVDGINAFQGVQRRLTTTGRHGGVTVLDSYAHHPSEIAADLTTARMLTEGRVIAVFEPTGWTRTAALGEEMGRRLAAADEVVLLDVHATVESPLTGVSTAPIAAKVAELGGRAHTAGDDREIEDLVAEMAGPGDLVVTMGTGTASRVGRAVLLRLADAPVAAPAA